MKSIEGFLNITIGEVVSTQDPSQMGRVKVFCSALDPQNYNVESLPWANYASVLGGSITNIVSGPLNKKNLGTKAYGWWGIPSKGSLVIVFSLNSDPNVRYYSFSIFDSQSNRSLPGGRNYDDGKPGPFTDEYNSIAYSENLKEAGLATGDMYYTRGGYERQVAQAKTIKDGKEGYANNASVNDGSLESQTYCFTTPGGHYFSFQDAPDFCRVRIKTTTGKQILLDDTNERIFVTTSKGNSWFEMDDDGRFYFYGKKDISFGTDGNLNFSAKKSINLDAGESINLTAKKDIYLTAQGDAHISAGSLLATAKKELSLKGQSLIVGGTVVDIGSSGPMTIKGASMSFQAAPAKPPTPAKDGSKPTIVPAQGGWERPHESGSRNPYWRK